MLSLWLLACTAGTGDSADTSPPQVQAPGVLRLGPPAPAVGIYGIAATPDHVYVSNLHVPFITVADPATGAWQDALDLRELGIQAAYFPLLFTWEGELLVTAFDQGLVLRFDLDTHEALGTLPLPDGVQTAALADDGLWVSASDGQLHRVTGEPATLDVGTRATAMDFTDTDVAVVNAGSQTVSLFARDGRRAWEELLPGAETLQDVLLVGGRVYVTDRATGQVHLLEQGAVTASVTTGSDTFALEAHEDLVLVTNRQGSALPESGSYEGGPARVTALDAGLGVVWTVDVDKTIHFLAWDGTWWWTANEDALRLSAIDPVAGVEAVRGPPLGLTLDHLVGSDGTCWAGSHLTDELWRIGSDGEVGVLDTCGWPFVTVPHEGSIWLPCQEDGRVVAVDPETLETTASHSVAATFHPVCDDGLCTGHAQLMDATVVAGELLWSDPRTASIQGLDREPVVIGDSTTKASRVVHFAVREHRGGIVAFEPVAEDVVRVEGDAETARWSLPPDEEVWAFPLVVDHDRLWIGRFALDEDLVQADAFDPGVVMAAAGHGWRVGLDGEDLVVWDDALSEAGRVSVRDLRVPPYETGKTRLDPLRLLVLDAHTLVVVNTFRGTLERVSLPSLAPLGDDDVMAAGHWAELAGLR